MRGTDRTPLAQRQQYRFDKTVARVTGRPLAVRTEVGQLALTIPDRYARAGRQVFGTGQFSQWLEGAERTWQLSTAAGLLYYIERHPLWSEMLDQFRQVLLVADVARAGRVPEVHQADRPGPGDLGRQLQPVAGEQCGLVIERA
ncbi:hypothetical protein D3C75_848010 [compost metagenome]